MQSVIKGMVQVAGSTYRIVRAQRGQYSVIRTLDDQHVGAFTIQRAKTTWVGQLALG